MAMRGSILAQVVSLASAQVALCATNYWDNNGVDAGFGSAGGTWGLEQKWSADSSGASLPGTTSTTSDDDLFFGTLATGLSSGTIAVSGAGQPFRSLTFGTASGAITLSGGPLALGAAPVTRITVNNASNTIACALTGTNSLWKFGSSTYAGYLTTNATTVFSNLSLAEFIGADGVMGGFSISGGTAPADAYFFVNNRTNATYQLQTYNGGYTKCVKVELTQVGSDIAARVLYAKYLNQQNVSQLGFNFDEGGTSNTIATSVGTGGYGAAQTTLSTLATCRSFLDATAAVIFTNTALACCVGADGVMGGAWIAGGPIAADAYRFTNDGATASYQLQALNDVYTKCVKVELTQAGPHVAARAVYAKYIGGNQLGIDFDVSGTAVSLAVSNNASGYGAAETTLMTASENTRLTLTGNSTYSGATLIGNGSLVLDDQGRLGGGAYAGAIFNSGLLVAGSSSDQSLSGAHSGGGALVKGFASSLPSVSYSNFLGTSAATVFTGASLSGVRSVSGLLGGLNIDNQPQPAYAFQFTNDGATATSQLQIYDGTYTKCVKVELTQVGADIAARVLYARYLTGFQLGANFDAVANTFSIATSASSSGYGVARTTLLPYPKSRLALSGSSSYVGGTTISSGVIDAKATAALPSSGGVVVNAPGELWLNAGDLAFNNAGGVGNGNPITVNTGAALSLVGAFNAGYSRALTLNGGTLNVLAGATDDSNNYICNLTLMNGAKVVGRKLRVGYHSVATFNATGSSPSSISAGLILVNNGQTLVFNVSNVTADAAADLTMAGAMRDMAGFTGLPVVKNGAGTLALSVSNACVSRFTVQAGTLALATNSALNAGNNVVLSGGTLAMGAYTNALGTLAVSTNSILELGAGKLAFAASSAVAWTNRLSLVGTLGDQTLRFGTSNTALTAQQLAAIDINGKPVRLRSDGYVSQRHWGAALILR